MGQGGTRPWQRHSIARCGSLAIRPFTYIRANNLIQSPFRNFHIRGAVATYFFTSPLIHIHFFLSVLRPFCYLLLQHFLFHFSTTLFSLLYLRQHILFSTSTLIVISRDIGDTRRSFGIFTWRLHSSYFFYISAATTVRQWAFFFIIVFMKAMITPFFLQPAISILFFSSSLLLPGSFLVSQTPPSNTLLLQSEYEPKQTFVRYARGGGIHDFTALPPFLPQSPFFLRYPGHHYLTTRLLFVAVVCFFVVFFTCVRSDTRRGKAKDERERL